MRLSAHAVPFQFIQSYAVTALYEVIVKTKPQVIHWVHSHEYFNCCCCFALNSSQVNMSQRNIHEYLSLRRKREYVLSDPCICMFFRMWIAEITTNTFGNVSQLKNYYDFALPKYALFISHQLCVQCSLLDNPRKKNPKILIASQRQI